MKYRWMLKRNSVDSKAIAEETGINELIINILANRDIRKTYEIKRFMNCSFEDLIDPHLMKDMDKGLNIIINSIKENKKIVIYGDYDADGVTSTTILYKAVKKCGGNVSFYIPDREEEGYGINSERIKILREQGFEVILTCDNGISAIEQVKLAKTLGLEIVITDHHDVPYEVLESDELKYLVPEADAVINPKQKDCKYPFKMLCGAGIAFKFVQLLYKEFGLSAAEANEYVELAAIGTICDVVDVIDENRIIVKHGLKLLNNTKNVGIKALKEETGIQDKNIGTYHVGFIIGPCINATGRLDTASISVELLLCEEEQKATLLAKRLNELNTERQNMTTQGVEEITKIIEESKAYNQKVLLVYNENIHESIAGIVAGRIKEKYNRPTFILTKGKNMAKGSGRSIEDYNMFAELQKCKDLIDKFGGHPMAAGLSIKNENIKTLSENLNKNCELVEENFIPKLVIDRQIKLNQITNELIESINLLEPFGKGNPTPVFAEKNVEIIRAYFIGKDNNILKLFCKIKNNMRKIDGICFDGAEKFKSIIQAQYGQKKLEYILGNNPADILMDIVFTPSINEYNGVKNIQLIIKDFRLSMH